MEKQDVLPITEVAALGRYKIVQSLGKALPASDRYSLAVVAYKLLTDHVPFDGDSPFAVALKHIQDVPPPPRQFNPGLSQDIEQVLLHGLAKDPDQRPTSCVAFVDELERLHHHPPHLVPRVENDPASTLIKPMDELHSARRSSPPQETSQAGEVPPVIGYAPRTQTALEIRWHKNS
ncbi:hypothetical protein KSC_041060 [Ktedonobacter sp. SOSP1-52]|uniref:hypothetical protein n=1 Tax=Ktedonobacter sp. SOSP1-52 TaxID=2778366 RepID=UPI001914DB1B|nr:hypothetical protein [Ktedonobacter sp. SOSP1-52]GHO65214.1 hypothetical protein KSC_041060 [Ktedonobacter sp. SOSP1-52]